MNHPTESHRGEQYPTPGKWSLNWVEGEVVSWRHDPQPDRKNIHTGAYAHLFVVHGDGFADISHRLEVNGDEVEVIDDTDDRDALFERVGDLLIEHTP